MGTPFIQVEGISKSFTLHNQGGITLPVLDRVDLTVRSGECIVITGPSGAGKSSLLKCIYGNYLTTEGRILIGGPDNPLDVTRAAPRNIVNLRRNELGYVSQFLRVVPRVPAIEVVMEPLLMLEADPAEAREKAANLLTRLNIPERLWSLAPSTFSGGEQQRINLARGFVVDYPGLLLDEPTASLDAVNRGVVVDLINEAKERGAAIIGIFHDQEVRDLVADRELALEELGAAA